VSAVVRDDQLGGVDKLGIGAPKTRARGQLISTLVGEQSALLVVAPGQKTLRKSVSNLPDAHSIVANYLNIRDLLKYDKVIMSLDALDVVKSVWGAGA